MTPDRVSGWLAGEGEPVPRAAVLALARFGQGNQRHREPGAGQVATDRGPGQVR